ncbi:uncharacterized protein M6B38_161360 [Iris pallida]|uniref:Calcineurin-like phosphoesterase domain-containing protein n=1 Tax=Iris pallida TaxID=29817 RepID=A0AAX6EZA9_IRIPA|nr:uncharacterized protein M6B38_161360 [Iris pallida]
MDRTSLSLPPGSFVLGAVQFYTDLYMRRSFRSSVLPFDPHVLVFLGDHFDGGPFLSDQEWQESLRRFRHIFSLQTGRKSDMSVYYLSGNHDIGYSSFHSLYPKVISRYEQEFGARNYYFSARKVDFIVVDAQTLDGPVQKKQTSLSWDFIKNVSKVDSLNPRILLTHIPLYRPDDTPCGPYRSSSVINQRIAYATPDQEIKYQNYLSSETSSKLLRLIRPILVLSGHDHDQCTVTHSTPLGDVPEHTLGTISWQQGNLYPSFMLLTVTGPSNLTSTKPEVSTQLCFLPMQTHIYVWYLSQFVVTLLLLVIWPTNGFGCWDRFSQCKSSVTMHLVKKASTPVPVTKTDAGSTGRGNVTLRAAAKKHTSQGPEESAILNRSLNAKSDQTGKSTRLSKSKAWILIQRLLRVVRSVVVIAAVNVPLYMMLLFKDWVDR